MVNINTARISSSYTDYFSSASFHEIATDPTCNGWYRLAPISSISVDLLILASYMQLLAFTAAYSVERLQGFTIAT